MSTRVLIAICGAACALAPANAQTMNQRDRDRDQPRQYERDARTQQNARSDMDGQALLQNLEGIWRVDATINDSYMKMAKNKMHSDMKRDRDMDRDARRDNQRDAERETWNEDDKKMAGKTDDAQLKGVAETRLILGNVLQGEAYIMKADGKNPDSIDWNSAGEGMKGLSYIAFNPDTGTYDAVFMNNKDNEIMYSAGTYDKENRRIIFHGKADNKGSEANSTWDRREMNRPGIDRDKDRDEATRRDRDNRNWTDRDQPQRDARDRWNDRDDNRDMNARGLGEVTVVLEVMGNDKHRVTMYRGTPNFNTTGLNNDRPGMTPDNDNDGAWPTTRDQNQRDQNEREQAKRGNPDRENKDDANKTMRDGTDLANNIVYQATYTRVSGAEAAEFRRKLDGLADEDQITRR